jgi:hypothetical protein
MRNVWIKWKNKKEQFINQHDKIFNEKDLRKKDESYKAFEEIEKGKKLK